MKIDDVPAELLDDLLGDHETRIALERATSPVRDVTFTMPDATGYDGGDIATELERAALAEMLTGLNATDAQRAASARGSIRKRAPFTGGEVNPATGQRWGASGFTPAQRREYVARF
jgi:hypothetical protein